MPPSKAKSSRSRNLIAARAKKRSLGEGRTNKENAGPTVQILPPKGKKTKRPEVSVIKITRVKEEQSTTKELSTLNNPKNEQQSAPGEVESPSENLSHEPDALHVSPALTAVEPAQTLSQPPTVETPIAIPANPPNTLTELLVPLILPDFPKLPPAQSSAQDSASATPPKPSPTAELASQIRLAAAVCECLSQRCQTAEQEATVADSLALATAGMVAEHPIRPYREAANISSRKAYEAKFQLVKLREQEAEARYILEGLVQRFNEMKASQRRTGAGKGRTR